MKRRRLPIAVLVIPSVTAGAQQRAPQNESITQIARLIHQASWDIANADSRPKPPTSHAIAQD